MNKAAIMHRAGGKFAFPVNENTLMVRLKAARDDLKSVKIIYGSRYPENGFDPGLKKELKKVASDEENDYFATTISLKDSRFRYHFYLNDGKNGCWYNEKGFFRFKPKGFEAGYFQYPFINESEIFKAPEWVQDSIFYQIFPDRFYNGNKNNDPSSLSPWGEKPASDSFFGGDLEGIIKKLDYIQNFGVNAIYLTPIFKSPSNHKYNIDDYYQIDPHFGDLNTAKRLVNEAHKRGIKIVLDAVFNHSGYDFFAFKDVRERGENSPYKNWFYLESLPVKTDPPVNYKTFANDIVNMPKLRTDNNEVKEYFLEVVRYWTEELDIDGWRLDVANEIDHQFWREFRQVVKEIKPDAYIVGEIWHNSEDWLQGDQFDAVMNYPLAEAILDFFARKKIGPETFSNRLSKIWMSYQDRVSYAMLNLINSHDTPRLLHYFNGNKEAMKLALLFQMTYPGVPMIYYGDEIGLTGGNDPDCRRCMIWERAKQDIKLFNYYKKIIGLRRKLVSLRRGSFKPVIIDDTSNVFGYKRTYKNEEVIVIINNNPWGEEIEMEVKPNYLSMVDMLSKEKYYIKGNKLHIKLYPYQGVILKVT